MTLLEEMLPFPLMYHPNLDEPIQFASPKIVGPIEFININILITYVAFHAKSSTS